MKKMTHLESAGENYLLHMSHAFKYAGKLAYATAAVIIHAFYPQWHQNTASNIAREIAGHVDSRHAKNKK